MLDAEGDELVVTVNLPTGRVHLKVWHIDVGRVKLYLLDTNIPENVLPRESRHHGLSCMAATFTPASARRSSSASAVCAR